MNTMRWAVMALVLGGGCRRGEPPAAINMASRQAILGDRGVVGVEAIAAFDQLTAADRARLASLRVFWGHQSVGRELMGGAGRLGYAFQTVSSAADYPRVTRGEALVADNRDPARKVRSFRTLVLDQGIGGAVQVAAFKFCWIDFNTDTDLDAIERQYADAVTEARRRFPGLRILHVTPPLTSDEPRENRIRMAFGQRLRQRYAQTDVVFDLAEVQSTRDDGGRCVRDNSAVLCDAYRSDEGHFNDGGADRAAKAFLYAILRAAGAPT